MARALSVSVKDAKKLAKSVAKDLSGGEVLALTGPLGSGKTTFTRALARELGIRSPLRSPTFILMQSFKGRRFTLHHLDLYRLKGKKEILALGLHDFLGKKNGISVIEWADKAKGLLPKKTIHINFL